MAAVAHLRRTLVHQPQVCLIDEGGGLQGVIRPFPAQMALRDAPQFLVHEGQETAQRVIVSGAPKPEELAGRGGRRGGHQSYGTGHSGSAAGHPVSFRGGAVSLFRPGFRFTSLWSSRSSSIPSTAPARASGCCPTCFTVAATTSTAARDSCVPTTC